ncbi:energy transducer TonB [Winogradskyella luteola]|uniref:Energy transducer TonB n=1 Tax=Winogradskyella luteola TaxID=2828330 RepID=A0A9X1JS85_9FLAO|nr:energy transducer TonB [Winogradskyella luteola]MBV7269377.1 energy transducer TonB [Winogradskyella luteola]
MKSIRLFTILFIAIQFTWAQEHPEFYNRPFVIFEGCDDIDDKERCYEIKLQELIGKNLNLRKVKDTLFFNAEKDTIVVHTGIMYNEKGAIDKEYSYVSTTVKDFSNNKMKYFLDSIPNVKPVLDDYDNGVSSRVQKLFGFLLDKTNDSIVPILGYTPEEVPFSYIEKVPVYKGSNKRLDNIELKKCMNEKVKKLVSENFNPNLASKLGLSPGVKRIFVMFKIDKKGNVTNIVARGPHKALEEEAIRVIKKIPKLKKPGYQRKKPVIVPYALPIIFRVNN